MPSSGGGDLAAPRRLLDSSTTSLLALGAVLAGDALLEGVEAIGLWGGRRWADYLTFIGQTAVRPAWRRPRRGCRGPPAVPLAHAATQVGLRLGTARAAPRPTAEPSSSPRQRPERQRAPAWWRPPSTISETRGQQRGRLLIVATSSRRTLPCRERSDVVVALTGPVEQAEGTGAAVVAAVGPDRAVAGPRGPSSGDVDRTTGPRTIEVPGHPARRALPHAVVRIRELHSSMVREELEPPAQHDDAPPAAPATVTKPNDRAVGGASRGAQHVRRGAVQCRGLDVARVSLMSARLLKIASRWWQIETLYRFNARFSPIWVSRFLLVDAVRDVPRIVAAFEAEGSGGRPPALPRLLRR